MKPTVTFSPPNSFSRWSHRLIFFLLALLLFAAPLIRGGNRQVALAGLLALGLGILAVIAARLSSQGFSPGAGHATPSDAPSPVWWLLVGFVALSPVWIGGVQLVPIGSSLWADLPGRSVYLPAVASAGVALPEALPLSLNPSATQAALWAGLPAGAALIAAALLSHRQAEAILTVLLAAAGVQALLGALQFGLGPGNWLYFGSQGHHVIGTFANRNHLAEFLAMLLPAWFYFLVRRSDREDRHARSVIPVTARKPLWITLGLLMVVVTLTTASRGGSIAMSITAMLSLGLYLFSQRKALTRAHKVGIGVLIAVLVLLVVSFVELDRLGRRIESDVIQSDAAVRWAYTVSTFQAGVAFWPLGSGIGTFESVFPRFQALESTGFVNQAHNDYAQVFMETGIAGIAVALVALGLVVRQAVRLVRHAQSQGRLGKAVALRAYAGFGLVGMLVHSWAEYNLYTPALAITAASLLGLYLRPLSDDAHSGD